MGGGCFSNAEKESAEMVLRDEFAALAMQGDWAAQDLDQGYFSDNEDAERLKARARLYYRMSDAMLAVRDEVHP